jgi:phage gp36-like protein
MTSYTTVDRVLQADPQIGSVSDITSSQIATVFIADAEAMIDSYLAKYYTTPVSAANVTFPVLTAIATDITIYRILSHRVFTQERLKNSVWPDRFKEGIAWLEGIAQGGVTLVGVNSEGGGVVQPDIATNVEMWSNTIGYHPTMSELDEEYSTVDSEKIDDLELDRT